MLKIILKIMLCFFLLLSSVSGNAGVDSFLKDLKERSEEGIGKWQEMPFGRMRLMTCSNGVKGLTSVIGGLQVQLYPEWRLKEPTLKSLSNQVSFWKELPLHFDEFYTGEVFFPLTYTRDVNDSKDFDFGVQGNFPACHKDKCTEIPIRLVLPLSFQKDGYTSTCAYILQRKQEVPLPAKILGINGYAWEIEKDRTQLLFTGVKGINMAFLYPLKEEQNVLETQLESDAVFMQLKKGIGELPKEFILLTNSGVFKIPVERIKEPINYSTTEEVLVGFWLLGWELFFLTPLFIWWGIGVARNSKIWKKEIIKMCLFFPLFFFLKMALFFFGKGIFYSQGYVYFSIFLLGLVCLFPPRRWYIVLGVFLVWPLSFQLPKMTMNLFGLWSLLMFFEISIPFVFLYLKNAEIGKILREMKKKNFFLFNFFFLLPTVIIFVFSLKQIYWSSISYSKELNPDGLTVVCHSMECVKWQKLPELYLIDSKTVLGQSLQKIYRRDKKTLIIWQKNGKRTILSPDLSIRKILKFIDRWQSYHAFDRPKNLPVRFQDDLRAL